MKLDGRVVLITGGGSGLGREMALLFASEGAKIGVNDVRPEAAQNVVTEIERAHGQAKPFIADVSSSAAVKKMFTEFLAAYGLRRTSLAHLFHRTQNHARRWQRHGGDDRL